MGLFSWVGRDWRANLFYLWTTFSGLPPRLPLALEAAFLARLVDSPPTWPNLDAILVTLPGWGLGGSLGSAPRVSPTASPCSCSVVVV